MPIDSGPDAVDTDPVAVDVPLPRLTLRALTWGPPDGPLALCLHGYPDTAWTWRLLGPELGRQGWRVVAPFLPGYAPSDRAPDGRYDTGILVEDVLDLHRALGGDDRALLVGHDWGAIVAYAVGAEDTAPFARMVTMAVPPLRALGLAARDLVTRGDVTVLRQVAHSWYVLLNLVPGLAERLLPRVVPFLWRQWSPGYDAGVDLDHLARALPDRGHRTAALRYYRHFVLAWRRSGRALSGQRRAMQPLRRPTLYLHGSRDGCLVQELTRHARECLPPGSDVRILASAGHFLQLERPDEVTRAVLEFAGHP